MVSLGPHFLDRSSKDGMGGIVSVTGSDCADAPMLTSANNTTMPH
jgi:hypothetical protein